jgi:hypothetical protein
MHVAFYAEQLYYLPQFTPVIAELLARGHRVTTLVRLDRALREIALPSLVVRDGVHDVLRLDHAADAYVALRRLAPDWAVFGSFIGPKEGLAAQTRTALVYHGIGVKNVLFDARLNAFDLRCVESRRVFDELVERDPAARQRLALVGFAKLDPLFAPQSHADAAGAPASGDATPAAADERTPARQGAATQASSGAPSSRVQEPVARFGVGGAAAPPPRAVATEPTVLYAPTFYPSSLELMPKSLRSLCPRAKWIVKPHFFSWTVKEYAGQRRRLEAWAGEPGVEVLGPESYDLVPLMARADVLVSDASSALFEFAALRKPVVWCRFLKLRWTYRGPLAFRLRKRMDPNTPRYEAVAHCVDRVEQLPGVLEHVLTQQPAGTADEPPERAALIEHLIGTRDGRASQRIVDELERRLEHPRAPVTAPGGSPR